MIQLRPFLPDDAEPVQLLLNDRQVSQYLTSRVAFPYSLEDARRWVEQGCLDNPTWAIEYGGELAGCIGVEPDANAKAAAIGYWIGRPFWGRGVATAAVAQVTSESLRPGGLERLYAGVFHTNLASMRVLQKCGYQLEAILCQAYFKQGKYYDKHLYAIEASVPSS